MYKKADVSAFAPVYCEILCTVQKREQKVRYKFLEARLYKKEPVMLSLPSRIHMSIKGILLRFEFLKKNGIKKKQAVGSCLFLKIKYTN